MSQLVFNSRSSVPPTLAWLICLPFLDRWPLLGLPAFAMRATIYTRMQQHLTRTTPDLTLAPPLPVGRLLSCSSPCSAVSIYILYISWARTFARATFVHISSSLVHYPSTTAPLRNLMQPSTCAPLLHHYIISCSHLLVHHYVISCSHLFVHHCSISCTSCPPLVHLSCTSNHCRGTSCSLAIGTSYSCTRTCAPTRAPTCARAPIIEPTHCPIQEGLGPSPWQAHNIQLAIVN